MSFSIDEHTSARVNGLTQEWRQGDVVGLPTSERAWMAAPDVPLTLASESMEADDIDWVVASTDRLAIVSQTCDIVRDCREHPFVTLAAVVELDEPYASQARRGHRPRFIPLSGISAMSFADMNLLVGAEKSILLKAQRISGLRSVEDQRQFARAAARVFERPAFPDDLGESLRGLLERVKKKHGKMSPEGKALESLAEIRVVVEHWADSDGADIRVLFCPESRPSSDSDPTHGDLETWIAQWMARCRPVGIVHSVDGVLTPLDEMTAREYLASDPLDLDYLSDHRE